jgi:autotransporter-associated beta strand protein
LLLAALALAWQALPVTAQDVWQGSGSDANWATTANWVGGVAPTSGTAIEFQGTTKLNNTNTIANLTLSGITFNNMGFNIYGTSITNTNGILDTIGSNTIALIQSLGISQTFTNTGNSSYTNIISGAITNNGFNLNFTGGGNFTVSGIIGGTNTASTNAIKGSVTTDNNFNGQLRLTAANTFTGGVTNNAGTIQLGNASAIPSGAGKGDVYVYGNLDIDAVSPTINGLYGTGNVENSSGTATYTISLGNNSTNSAGNFSGSFSQNSGIIALTKVNTNSFTLNSSANYSGPTLITAGSFILGQNGNLSSTNINVSPGALFDVSQLSSGFTLNSGSILYAGRATNPAAGIYDINGSLNNDNAAMVVYTPSAAGTMSINGSLTVGGTMEYNLGATTTVGAGVNGLIIINGTLTLGTASFLLNPETGTFQSGGTYTLISNITGSAVSGSVSGLTAVLPRQTSATFAIDANNNLVVTITGTGAVGNLTWAGSSTLDNWDVQASEDWINGSGASDYFYDLDNVIFNDSGYGTVNVAVTVSPDSITASNTAVSYTLSGPGAINGSGGFTKTGTNLFILDVPASYSGNTTVNNGALVLGTLTGTPNPNVAIYNGVTPGNLYLNGGGLYMNGAINITYQANFNQVIVGPGNSSLNSTSRKSSSQSMVEMQQLARTGVGGTIDVNYGAKNSSPQVGVMISNTTSINGILGGWATYADGDWLVPTNTITGSTNLLAAKYQTSTTPSAWGVNSNVYLSASPAAAVTANTIINTLKIAGATLTNNSGVTLTLSTGGLLAPTGGAAAAITGGTLLGALNADLIVNGWSTSPLTIGSVIADNTNASATQGSALTKSGVGTLILTNANTYTGPTYINGIAMNGQPSGGTPAWFAAGTLQLGAGGSAGSINNSSSVIDNGNLTFDLSSTSGYAGVISGSGAVKQIGTGTTVLAGDNPYSGATSITAGALQLGAGGSTGSISNSPTVADAGTLVFDRTTPLTYAGTISGLGSVVNAGPGTTTLTGTNTYTGATIVMAGTLALGPTGSISNSTLVSNVSGTTFDVSAAGGLTLSASGAGQMLVIGGNVAGNVVVSGATTAIVPGGVGLVGTAAFNNNLTLSGGKFEYDVNYPAFDLITVAGVLNLASGAVTINNLGGSIPNGQYVLATAGSITGSAANLTAPNLNQTGQVDYLTNTATQLILVVENGAGANLVWVGDNANNYWNVDSSADWNNGVGASVFHNGDYVTFNDVGDNNSTVNIETAVGPAAVTNNALNTDYTYQGPGKVTLGASLTKLGTDNLNILTPNDYSGFTAILAGAINVGNGGTTGCSIGTGAVTNNAVLNFNIPDTNAIAGPMFGNGALNVNGSGQLNLTGNNSGFSGPITINSGILQVGASLAGGGTTGTLGTGLITNNTLLVVNRSGSPLFYANSITGGGVISNIGSATLTLSGSNSYTGNTVIEAGSIKVGSVNAIPNGSGTGNVELDGQTANAGIFDLNGFNASINGLTGTVGVAPGTVANNAGSGVNTLTIGTGGATATYSGQIVDYTTSLPSGKVAVLVTGGATQTFDIESSTGNTYSGGTIISNATLTLASEYTTAGGNEYGNANAVALGTGPVTLYGGTLNVVGSSASTTPTWYPGMGNNLIVPAGWTGTVTGCQRGAFSPATVTGGGTLTYIAIYVRGSIGGNWSGFTGQVIFEGSSSGGNIGINSTNGFNKVFCSSAAGGSVTLYNTVAGTPTISFGELADDGTTTIESTASGNALGLAAIFSVGSANTSTNFGGLIGVSDNVGIAKVGTGVWGLTNATATAYTYTGPTTVSNGILAFSNVTPIASTPYTIAAPGILDVSGAGGLFVGTNVDQTLTGNGTIEGNLTVGSGGVLQPGGGSIGTLSVSGATTLNGAALMRLNITNGAQTNDILVTSGLTISNATLTISNTGPVLYTGDTFQLFKAGNITSKGGFSSVTLPPSPGNGVTYIWNTNNLLTTGTITLTQGASLVNLTPTNVVYSVSDGQLNLSWPASQTGWYLLTQTNAAGAGITTNWVVVAGSNLTNAMSFAISSNGTAYFSLLYTTNSPP